MILDIMGMLVIALVYQIHTILNYQLTMLDVLDIIRVVGLGILFLTWFTNPFAILKQRVYIIIYTLLLIISAIYIFRDYNLLYLNNILYTYNLLITIGIMERICLSVRRYLHYVLYVSYNIQILKRENPNITVEKMKERTMRYIEYRKWRWECYKNTHHKYISSK